MFIRSQTVLSKIVQNTKSARSFIPAPLTRAIHVKSKTGLDGAFTVYTLENDVNAYQPENGIVSAAYKNAGWSKFQSLLSSNLFYTFVHNAVVKKTNDTPGHTIITGHISSFMTDENAKIIKDSVMVMRDSSYAVGSNGCVLTINGKWHDDIPTSQLIYKVNFIDMETEVKNYFLGRDQQKRFLTAIKAPLEQREMTMQNVPRTKAEYKTENYIHYDGKPKEYVTDAEFINSAAIANCIDTENIIQEFEKGSKEAADLLKEIFTDIHDEKKRQHYIPKTKFFSKRAFETFNAFWQSLSEDNRRTIAINQSDPLCAEIVYYQGRAYQGLGDYITARLRFYEAAMIDESYKDKAKIEIEKIDPIINNTSAKRF